MLIPISWYMKIPNNWNFKMLLFHILLSMSNFNYLSYGKNCKTFNRLNR